MNFLALLLLSLPALASDHIDGPVTTQNAVADLTDLYSFPTPDKAGSLSVVLNTYPLVAKSNHFSDKVTYDFIVRRAQIAGENENAHFDTSDEVTISCSFQTPADTARHAMSCKSSNGLNAGSIYNKVQDKQPGDDFRAFAGMRSDPFFFNAKFAEDLSKKGKINPPQDKNIMDHANVMSIALDLDLKTLFKGNPPTMVAVAAQSNTTDGPGSPRRPVDRIGRPEITNVSMVAHNEPDLRDGYNLDRPFAVDSANQKKYEDRLAKNIAFFDAADGKKDWPDAERKQMAGILAADFQVVDMSKPCKDGDYLEIEKAMVAHKPHETCGGRRPNDEVMKTIFSTYVNNNKGEAVTDGVTHPYLNPPKAFPYLAEPDLTNAGRIHVFVNRTALTLKGMFEGEVEKLKKQFNPDDQAPDAPKDSGTAAPAN